MSIVDLWRMWRLKRRLEQEVRMGWDWQTSVKKASITAGKAILAMLVTAAVTVPDSAVSQWLLAADVPPGVVLIATPIVMGAIRFYRNKAKHMTPGDEQ